jgi:hypothetical protein
MIIETRSWFKRHFLYCCYPITIDAMTVFHQHQLAGAATPLESVKIGKNNRIVRSNAAAPAAAGSTLTSPPGAAVG